MEEQLIEFGTPRENEERRDGGCAVVFDPVTQRYAVGVHDHGGYLRLFSGGVDAAEDIVEGTLREVTEESGLYEFAHVEVIGRAMAHYRNSLRKVNRVTKVSCILVTLRSTRTVPTKLETHETFTLGWATMDEIMANWKAHNEGKDVDHWIYFMQVALKRLKELGIT